MSMPLDVISCMCSDMMELDCLQHDCQALWVFSVIIFQVHSSRKAGHQSSGGCLEILCLLACAHVFGVLRLA